MTSHALATSAAIAPAGPDLAVAPDPAPRRSLAERLAQLSGIAMLVVLVCGTIASAGYWLQCTISHGLHRHWHALESVCSTAALTALATATVTIYAALRLRREGTNPSATWALVGTVLAVGYAGANLLRLALETAGIEGGTVAGDGGASSIALNASGLVVGLLVATSFGRMTLRAHRGEELTTLDHATIGGVIGLGATWSLATLVSSEGMGDSSVTWTQDPTLTIITLVVAGSAAAGATLLSAGDERRWARRALVGGTMLFAVGISLAMSVVALGL